MNNEDKIKFTPLERTSNNQNVSFTPLERTPQSKRYQESYQKAYQKSVTNARSSIESLPKTTKKGNINKIKRTISLIMTGIVISTSIAIAGVAAKEIDDLVTKKKALSEDSIRVESIIQKQYPDLNNINYKDLTISEVDLYSATTKLGLDLNSLVKSLGYKDEDDFLRKKGMYQKYDNGIQTPSIEVWKNYEEARIVNAYKKKEDSNGRKH